MQVWWVRSKVGAQVCGRVGSEKTVLQPTGLSFGCAAGQQLDCAVGAEPGAQVNRALSSLEQCQGHAAPGSPVWMMPPHSSVGT